MSGHNIAVESIKEWPKNSNQPLTESNIRSLHTMILVKPFWSAAVTETGIKTTKEIKVGEYKTLPNSVQLSDGSIFKYSEVPIDVPIEMKDLLD